MIRKLLIAICLTCLPVISVAKSYLCVPDLAVGFSYNKKNKKWQVSKYTPTGKYIVQQNNAGNSAYKVMRVGGKYSLAYCKDVVENDYIFCADFGDIFRIDLKNDRFLHSYTFGYIGSGRITYGKITTNKNNPYTEIGKCTPQ